jgi:hypothetical protein
LVEQAIRASVQAGTRIPTPTGRAEFLVDRLDSGGVTLLFGPKRTPTFFTWGCLEGIVEYVKGETGPPSAPTAT